METCISDVRQWMASDELMLNDDKTELIVTASRHLFKKAAVNTISVGDSDVSKVSVVRNLGARFDDQLTMAVPITKIFSAAFYLLHNIRDASGNTFQWMQLRLLSTLLLVAEQTTVIVYYMVYLSTILTSCREFKTQATRLVVMQGKFCHIIPVLHELRSLPVSFHINFKILLLTVSKPFMN